ncbi:MAG TPA: von Willebrand factor type A domain-containing protein, partial [Thermoanaerobaculia bacterium]|nr:von Willebrand factor type A domain-containing protein [Thermoanaerobaculia bacterium]
MTRPDRNDIERMLAAGDAPKPPEGLLERLHADIPEDLATGVKEEKREISFWRQGWLAAASLIAVVGMGYVMLRVFDTPEYQNEAFVAERATAPSTETSPRAEALSEFDADAAGVGNELGGTAPAAPSAAAAQAEGRAGAFAQEPASDSLEETRAERSVAAPRPTPALAARSQMSKSADRSLAVRATSTGELVDTEADPFSTFGLRVADSSWALVSRALMNGILPAPESVRPEELINYFRYSDTEDARGEVTLRTEGAESPMRADGSEHLLRVGVRVSSNPDLAVRGAKMQVEFNPDSVEVYRLVGYEQNQSRSAAMPQG